MLQPWELYAASNKDVRDAFNTGLYGTSLEKVATDHYNTFGQKEGRSWGSPTYAQPAAGLEDWQVYSNNNEDVRNAYAKDNLGLSLQKFAEAHYAKFGQGEGRAWGSSPAPTPAVAAVAAPAPTPVTYQIDPNQTSAGLLSSMLNSDSAYIKDAQNKAMDGMNTRGLLSSSMAQGAGVAAAYDRAAPIATNDASLYANRLTANQQSVNDMANANANRGLTASTFNAGASNDLTKLAFGSQLQQGLAANQAGLTKDVANNQAALEAKARTDTQAFTSAENAATREAALKTSMLNSETTLASANISAQTSRDVAEVNRQYSQAANLSTAATTLWNSFNTGVREITLSDLTTEAKNSAVAQYTSYMKAGLALQGSIAGDIDLTTLAASILPS